MKQHAIPQNIMDVEFKLFTKFTVREFAYMAIGIGFGGIFLFLFSKAIVPGVIAIPIFLISSSIGLGLALLPINEQNADVFLRNYLNAIRKPTLRVWRSEQFDEKVQWLAQQRGITLTEASMDRDVNVAQQGNTRVVGGTAKSLPAGQFIQEEKIEALDQEESQRLQQLDQVVVEELGPPPGELLPTEQIQQEVQTQMQELPQYNPQQEVQINYDQIMENPQPEATQVAATPQMSTQHVATTPEMTNQQVSSESTPPSNLGVAPTSNSASAPSESLPIQGIAPTTAQPIPDNTPTPTPTTSQPTTTPQSTTNSSSNQRQNSTPPPLTSNDQTHIKNEVGETTSARTTSSIQEEREITIDKNSYGKYFTEVEDYTPELGDIALFVSDKDDVGISGAMILIKDDKGTMVQALQSDPQGLVLPKKKLPKGSYKLKIEHDKYQFPTVNFILEDKPLPVINIDSFNKADS